MTRFYMHLLEYVERIIFVYFALYTGKDENKGSYIPLLVVNNISILSNQIKKSKQTLWLSLEKEPSITAR